MTNELTLESESIFIHTQVGLEALVSMVFTQCPHRKAPGTDDELGKFPQINLRLTASLKGTRLMNGSKQSQAQKTHPEITHRLLSISQL